MLSANLRPLPDFVVKLLLTRASPFHFFYHFNVQGCTHSAFQMHTASDKMEASTDDKSGVTTATLSLHSEGSPNFQMDGGRVKPVAPPTTDIVVNGEVNGDGEDHSEDENGVEVEVGHVAKKKKKSKSRSKSKRGLVSRSSASLQD